MKRAILIAVCAAAVAFGSVGCSSGGVRDAMYDEGIEVYNVLLSASYSNDYDSATHEKVEAFRNKYSGRDDLNDKERAILAGLAKANLNYMIWKAPSASYTAKSEFDIAMKEAKAALDEH